MAAQKSPLTPAALRRLTEPLVTVLADLDKALHKREAFIDIVEVVFLNALAAGINRDTLLKIAKNYSDWDKTLVDVKIPHDASIHVQKVISPTTLRRHIDAFVEVLGEVMRLYQQSEDMKSVAFEMVRQAHGAGVAGDLLVVLLDGVDQRHHNENLSSFDFRDIKALT